MSEDTQSTHVHESPPDKFEKSRRSLERGRRIVFLAFVSCFFVVAHEMFFPTVTLNRTKPLIIVGIAVVFLAGLILSIVAAFQLRKAPAPREEPRTRRERRSEDSNLLPWQRRK
tara:strand:- start:8586 stop:8927 length:342 start_codon:yes stop_codon:yes gene_type:complete